MDNEYQKAIKAIADKHGIEYFKDEPDGGEYLLYLGATGVVRARNHEGYENCVLFLDGQRNQINKAFFSRPKKKMKKINGQLVPMHLNDVETSAAYWVVYSYGVDSQRYTCGNLLKIDCRNGIIYPETMEGRRDAEECYNALYKFEVVEVDDE